MSSREIAELTGKLHKNVMADTRKMLEELGYQPADFSARYIDGKGESRECFNLPKDLTITLVSGYNVQMRYAITKRWMELEAQQAPALPTSFAEALRLAACSASAKGICYIGILGGCSRSTGGLLS